jgi:hypothetical protein
MKLLLGHEVISGVGQPGGAGAGGRGGAAGGGLYHSRHPRLPSQVQDATNIVRGKGHKYIESTEMEFLNINLAKVSSLLLLAIHGPFYWRIFKENLYSTKIHKTRKLESIHEKHFVEGKNKGRKPDKILSLKRFEFMPRNHDLQCRSRILSL